MRHFLRERRFQKIGALWACLVGLSGMAGAQSPGLPADARQALERSIAAHASGSVRVRLAYRGASQIPDQGQYPDGPTRPQPMTINIAIDEQALALAFLYNSQIDGDFVFPRQVGFANGRGFATRYSGDFEPVNEFPADADAFLPHRLLRTIREEAVSATLSSDQLFDRLSYRLASGSGATLLLDRRTHLLAAIQRPATPSVFGDQTRETRYGPYRRVGRALVPETLVVRMGYPALESGGFSLSLVSSQADGPTPAELSPPMGSIRHRGSSTSPETIALGRDVYLLRNAAREGQFSYNVLVVVFEDHVLVVEAALDDATSRRVIDAVTRLAPGLPIRRLVQTHHHGDHIGGIRTYLSESVTILAPQGMSGFVERIAAHSAITLPPIEEVTGERVIRDSRNELRIYPFPSEHAVPMLFVYLPAQRVLYQGDLISAGELPLNATSRAFLDWVRASNLPIDTLAGLHGRPLSGSELSRLIADGRLDIASPPS